jgi:hypothetical protein
MGKYYIKGLIKNSRGDVVESLGTFSYYPCDGRRNINSHIARVSELTKNLDNNNIDNLVGYGLFEITDRYTSIMVAKHFIEDK